MKKLLLLPAFGLLLMLFCSAAIAAPEENVSVTASVSVPVSQGISKTADSDDLKITAQSTSGLRVLIPWEDYRVDSEISGFYDTTQSPPLLLTEKDRFVSGRTYRLRIFFELLNSRVWLTAQAFADVNGKSAVLTQEGNLWELSADFVCIPSDFTPQITMEVSGKLQKVFDGEEVLLTCRVERYDGINYFYQWYRNGQILEEENGETLAVRNVCDSGTYFCKVSAAASFDSEKPEVTRFSGEKTVRITPLSVTVRLEDTEKNLFDPDPVFPYTVLGKVYDPLFGSPCRQAGEDVGEYAVTAGTLGFAAPLDQNYRLEFLSGKLTVLNMGELPFSGVSNLSDQSRIEGQKGAKIRISASKGAIVLGAQVMLSPPTSAASLSLAEMSDRVVLKSFCVSILDENGQAVDLPRHGTLRIQIPLTKEESEQIPESITAGFYSQGAKVLACRPEISADGMIYITVELKELGTVALYSGDPKSFSQPPSVSSPSKPLPPEVSGQTGRAFWVLTLSLGGISLIAVIWSLIWVGLSQKEARQKKALSRHAKPVQEEGTVILTRDGSDSERIRAIARGLSAESEKPNQTASAMPIGEQGWEGEQTK